MPNVVATASGYNSLPNGHFNGEAWSTLLNWKFYAQNVIHDISNTRWQGEVKENGTVNIRERPDITSNAYQRGAKINYQEITDSRVQLKTDQAELTAFSLDEIDMHQTNIDIMKELTFDAAQVSANAVDLNVLGSVYTDASLTITQSLIDKINVLEWLAQAWRLLSNQNVPKQGRWAVLPPEITEKISISDLKNSSLSGKSSTIVDGIAENGKLSIKISGFDIYESTQLTTTGGGSIFQCIAGHPAAIAFASSFQKSKRLDLIDSVGTAVQALNVYGFKVTKGAALVSMPATV